MEIQAIDFTECKVGLRGYDGADIKKSIIYNNKYYMVKFSKNIKEIKGMNSSYSNNAFSEFISCNIIQSIGLPAQNTLIGRYGEKIVVACEDFRTEGYELQEFSQLQNSYLDTREIERTPNLEDINNIFKYHERFTDKQIQREAQNRYWDTFVMDALLGNFDRHTGNWGYLINEKTQDIKLAPIYDCGGCLYPQISDAGIMTIKDNKEKIEERIYNFPKASFKINGERQNYFDFISSTKNEECNAALIRIVPLISFDVISEIISSTPLLSDIRKKFLNQIIKKRYDIILEPTYKKIKAQTKNKDINARTKIIPKKAYPQR